MAYFYDLYIDIIIVSQSLRCSTIIFDKCNHRPIETRLIDPTYYSHNAIQWNLNNGQGRKKTRIIQMILREYRNAGVETFL